MAKPLRYTPEALQGAAGPPLRRILAVLALALGLAAGPLAAPASAGAPETEEPPVETTIPEGHPAAGARADTAPAKPRQAVRNRISVRADIARVSPVAWLERYGEVERRPIDEP